MMQENAKITVLVENTAGPRGLLAEHGLAFWLEFGQKKILFDTGQGLTLEHNSKVLGIDLKQTDAVVLSHGHYDHTGGLEHILDLCGSVEIYAHPAAFLPKYSRRNDGSAESSGIPEFARKDLHDLLNCYIGTEHPTRIFGSLFATGQIPRMTDFEKNTGPFFVDRECRQSDLIPDDQAMYFESARGTVVLLGCAHSGIINTLQYIQRLTNNRPIHTVIGGTHLVSASSEKLEATIDELAKFNIDRLAAIHCTGAPAAARLWNSFPKACIASRVGTNLEFRLPEQC